MKDTKKDMKNTTLRCWNTSISKSYESGIREYISPSSRSSRDSFVAFKEDGLPSLALSNIYLKDDFACNGITV